MFKYSFRIVATFNSVLGNILFKHNCFCYAPNLICCVFNLINYRRKTV